MADARSGPAYTVTGAKTDAMLASRNPIEAISGGADATTAPPDAIFASADAAFALADAAFAEANMASQRPKTSKNEGFPISVMASAQKAQILAGKAWQILAP